MECVTSCLKAFAKSQKDKLFCFTKVSEEDTSNKQKAHRKFLNKPVGFHK